MRHHHHHRRRMAAFTLLTGVLVSCGSVVSPAGSDGSAAGATDRPATLATVRLAVDGCTLVGTGRDDVLRGTPAADVMCGHGGHDVLLGRGGDDTLEGGSGSDSLFGGTGADAVEGGDGIDLLDGGTRADVLDGGAGRDRCDVGPDDTVTSCATPSGSPVIAAAGDIACPSDYAVSVERCRQGATAKMLARGDAWTVLTTGDNQYERGTLGAFRDAYSASWGRVKAITRPSAGNHDYLVAGAKGYFRYFGPLAGERGKGYYSFDVGDWHIVALNSNCAAVGGCEEGSPQERWLRSDLESHPSTCTLAYWHAPRFSSGPHGNNEAVSAFWEALYDAGADVVLNGHDHSYERFAPQDPAQVPDANGIREFVVGTGGRSLYAIGAPEPNSEVRSSDTFGVLELTLHADGYGWRFVPAAGGTFEDSGTATCT